MKIFEGTLILYIVLILLFLILLVRISNNSDFTKENCKNETDLANIKNARKYYAKTKTGIIALIAAITLFLIFMLCKFTSIEAIIIDYLSTDFYTEKDFNTELFLIPLYILVIRSIIIEVKVGDYIFKYFQIEEPQLEENPLTNLLYKKKPGKGKIPKEKPTTNNTDNNTKKEEITNINENEIQKDTNN